jgi:hypothetical protein
MAEKYDILFALKEIQKFNRNLIDVNDLITVVAKHLLIRQTKDNLDQIKDHLMASADEDGNIPVDADLMRELLKMTKPNMNETKYKSPKDLEKSQKPTPRKDLKDYTMDNKDSMNPHSAGEKQQNVLRKTDKEVIDNGSQFHKYNDSDHLYKDLESGEYDPKHAAKVLKKRQDDEEKDVKDYIADKYENLTREQQEKVVRRYVQNKLKSYIFEQEDAMPTDEPATEVPEPIENPEPAATAAEKPAAEPIDTTSTETETETDSAIKSASTIISNPEASTTELVKATNIIINTVTKNLPVEQKDSFFNLLKLYATRQADKF